MMSTPTPAELLSFLQEHGFLSPSQVQQFSGDRLSKYADSQLLARELIGRNWLNAYQANRLLKGRGNDLLLGPYRLLERLGEGGMGQVFKAHHINLDRVVALKIIPKELVSNPTAVSRFYREARAVARLSHPNIVTAFDVSSAGQTHYLAMELVDGIDLARLVQQSGRLAISQACEFVRQAAVGLQHAHENGLVHRDIKPGNLVVASQRSGETPIIKILDFGLARFESESQRATRLTQLGQVIGTVDYIAPEQSQNSRIVDIRADIYSLGCTLFYLLTGNPPFPGDSSLERISARVLGDVPSVRKCRREVPAALDQILARMMARDPADRYQTPGEVAKSLAPFAKAGSKPVAKAVSAPAESVSSPVRGTKISPDTDEIKRVLREVPGQTPPKAVQAKEAASPFANLTGTGAASEKIVRVSEEAKPSRPAWWKRPGVLATVVGVSLALILTAVNVNWVKEQLANRGTVEHSTSEEKPSSGELQPAKAFVVLEIDQPGAKVFIDKQIDPAVILGDKKEFELDPGTHTLRIIKDGFEDYPQLVELKPGAKLPIEIKLKPKPKDVVNASKDRSKDSGNSATPTSTVRRDEQADPLVHINMGNNLYEQGKFPDAEAAYRKAIELKRDLVEAYFNLGNALSAQGKHVDAEVAFREAIKLKPADSITYLKFYRLGHALRSQGKHLDAEAAFREAIKLKPDFAEAYVNLGLSLSAQGKDGEEEAYRNAIDLKPNDAAAAYINLGAILNDLQRKHVDAEAAFRAAIKLEPENPTAYFNLSAALRDQGRFVESLAALQRGLELGSKQSDDWRFHTLQCVRQIERFVQLEKKLPAILQGKSSPANVDETIALARMCFHKKHHIAAVRLYTDAVARNPLLANDLTSEYRYYAACSAALGGRGQAEDAGKLDKNEQTRLRNKALEWLRADFELRRKQLNGGDAKAISEARKKLARWQRDSNLACVREEKALAELPEAERREWRKLWEEVSRTLKPSPVGDANRKNGALPDGRGKIGEANKNDSGKNTRAEAKVPALAGKFQALFRKGTIWKGTKTQRWTPGPENTVRVVMTVVERKGNIFRAKIDIDGGFQIRAVEGTITNKGRITERCASSVKFLTSELIPLNLQGIP